MMMQYVPSETNEADASSRNLNNSDAYGDSDTPPPFVAFDD